MPPKSLDPITALDLVTSLELTHRSSTAMVKVKVLNKDGVVTGEKYEEQTRGCYHFIYGSTLYGTPFGVYGQFDSVAKDGGAALQVTGLTMRILNYQGVLNIGFTDEAPPVYIKVEKDEKVVDRIIRFGVQGASGKENTFIDLTPSQLIVKKGERVRLTFERLLIPLAGFTALGDTRVQLPAPKQTDALFDTEFRYRNGIDHSPQIIRDGMKQPDPVTVDNMAGGSPQFRCLTSTVNLLYW
jgi:hypothetical protein